MRFNRLVTLGKIIILFAFLFSAQINGLAQSTTSMVAHYVEVTPSNDGISYNVNVYLSALESGSPIRDLKQEAFAIQEDGQKVEIQNLRMIAEEPTNIVLVMDTSGSMAGTGVADAKSAAAAFVSGLLPNDQVAILTFDDTVKTRIEFTNDKQAITDKINAIDATREAGTCLYEAAYAAIGMFSALPTGNRAVILFTDGKDETPTGAICSTQHTLDNVIEVASAGETRTPIYTLGIGEDSDTETLKKIAVQTGGLYINLSSSSKLANAFQLLSDVFRSQYILTYTSTSAPGAHSLIVSLNAPNQATPLAIDTRKFPLPSLPPHLIFTSPPEGATIADVLKIEVALTTQGQVSVERVAFEVNGIKEGEDDTKPYELELDAKKYPIGLMTVSVTAYGANNTELARSSINLVRAEATAVANSIPTEESAPLAETPTPAATDSNNSVVFMAIALGGLSIVAIAALLFFLLRQQKQAKGQELESYENDDIVAPMQGIPVYRPVNENRKASSPELESEALGALTVEASDDSSLIGHRFEITASLVTLGRSADNDINFPNDKPVSRHHAEIYQISNKLYLREVEMADASGTAKPPKYGTFLNQNPMGPDPALLKTGDEIQLGKRVRLKFEAYRHDMDADSVTYDEDDDLTAADDIDKTAVQD